MLKVFGEAELDRETRRPSSTAEPIRARILLAEDGPDNQRLISMMLRKAGAEVAVAENGQMAVDRARLEAFDLILMDMAMPIMDGYTAARTLRELGARHPDRRAHRPRAGRRAREVPGRRLQRLPDQAHRPPRAAGADPRAARGAQEARPAAS